MVDDNHNGQQPPLDDERPLGAEPEEGSWDDIHELHDPVMREHERPRDGFEPISVTLIMLIMALVGWGGWYLGAYSGAFQADIIDIIPLDEQAAPEPAVAPEPVDLDPMELGEDLYADCATCHQADGSGVDGTFPPLVGSERVLERPGEFAGILINGLEGPLVVDGVEYDGLMPDHGDWDDEELAAVMTYVRNSWGNDAEPIGEDFVADVRELTADRDETWTDPQLREFFDDIDVETLGTEPDAPPENDEQGENDEQDENGEQDDAPGEHQSEE